jgi:hypothetical protein
VSLSSFPNFPPPLQEDLRFSPWWRSPLLVFFVVTPCGLLRKYDLTTLSWEAIDIICWFIMPCTFAVTLEVSTKCTGLKTVSTERGGCKFLRKVASTYHFGLQYIAMHVTESILKHAVSIMTALYDAGQCINYWTVQPFSFPSLNSVLLKNKHAKET